MRRLSAIATKTKDFIRKEYKAIIVVLFLVLSAFVILAVNLNGQDEGSTLNIAWQLYNHRVLQRDYFEFISPGSGYFVYILWKMFGQPSYLLVKIASILLWFVATISMILTIRLKQKDRLAYLYCFVLWLIVALPAVIINHNNHSSFLSAIVLFLVSTIILKKKKNLFFLLATGFILGLITFTLQTKGLAVLVASLICLLFFTTNLKEKITNIFIVSTGCVSMFFLLNWLIGVDLSEIIKYYYLMPQSIKYLDSSFYSKEILLSEIIVVSVMFFSAIRKKNNLYAILTIYQIFLFCSMFYINELLHFFTNIFPFIIWLSSILAKIKEDKTEMIYKYLLNMINYVIILSFMCKLVTYSNELYSYTFTNKKQKVKDFFYTIKNLPGNVYFGPFLPGFYYTTNKINYYSVYSNMIYCDENCQSFVINQLEEHPIDLAVMNYKMVEKYHYQKTKVDYYIEDKLTQCGPKKNDYQMYSTDCKSIENIYLAK